jgi:hypothetical protein
LHKRLEKEEQETNKRKAFKGSTSVRDVPVLLKKKKKKKKKVLLFFLFFFGG